MVFESMSMSDTDQPPSVSRPAGTANCSQGGKGWKQTAIFPADHTMGSSLQKPCSEWDAGDGRRKMPVHAIQTFGPGNFPLWFLAFTLVSN